MKVLIYSKQYCPYCVRAKDFFKQKGIAFKEVDLTDDFESLERLKNKTNHLTVPQIFIDDVFIGGYTDLIRKFDNGEIALKK